MTCALVRLAGNALPMAPATITLVAFPSSLGPMTLSAVDTPQQHHENDGRALRAQPAEQSLCGGQEVLRLLHRHPGRAPGAATARSATHGRIVDAASSVPMPRLRRTRVAHAASSAFSWLSTISA